MTRYVYIPSAVLLVDEDDQPLKNPKTKEPEPPITMYRWFITNCTPVGPGINRQTGEQYKVGPGKAFGDGDKAARAIAHIKKALKGAEPGTYAALEHADWALWKKCCEEGDWLPGVSSQFIEFIDAVLDAKETAPAPRVVAAPAAAAPALDPATRSGVEASPANGSGATQPAT